MITYEIINPSDEVFIKSNDLKIAQMAVLLLAQGKYGLKDNQGKICLPLFLLGGFEEWAKENYGDTVEVNKFIEANEQKIAECLATCFMNGERSSINDIFSAAHNLSKRILGKSKMPPKKEL